MRRPEEIIPLLTLLGAISVGCKTQEPVSAFALPTLTPTPNAPAAQETEIKIAPPLATPEAILRDNSSTDELFPETSPRYRIQAARPRPIVKLTPELAPAVEIPAVAPNDILGRLFTKEPTKLIDGTVVPAGTLIAVLLKPNGPPLYLSIETARNYFEYGAVIPHWLSPDTQKKYIVTAGGKWVRSGPVNALEGTYMPIRHYDLGVGGFSGMPAVSLDGYVVTPKNGDELDAGEFRPHHGGTFWKAPKGWKISKVVFGTAERRGDLLLTLVYGSGETGLYWLVHAIPEFPQWVKNACGSATNELTHCMMEYVRDEKSKQRDINQKIEFVHVPESSGIFDAVVIWNPYP